MSLRELEALILLAVVLLAGGEAFYLARLATLESDVARARAEYDAARRRLTVEGARNLGLMVNFVPTPWSGDGGTYALAPTSNAPCQSCWHRRDAHDEFEPMLCNADCTCLGWDPFLDTEERAARA